MRAWTASLGSRVAWALHALAIAIGVSMAAVLVAAIVTGVRDSALVEVPPVVSLGDIELRTTRLIPVGKERVSPYELEQLKQYASVSRLIVPSEVAVVIGQAKIRRLRGSGSFSFEVAQDGIHPLPTWRPLELALELDQAESVPSGVEAFEAFRIPLVPGNRNDSTQSEQTAYRSIEGLEWNRQPFVVSCSTRIVSFTEGALCDVRIALSRNVRANYRFWSTSSAWPIETWPMLVRVLQATLDDVVVR